ncbi:hypothetical protein GIB67_040949 [Kingdonia uniflora]|uniref:Uncharacterized protein n=1 Tax=Kingdonia uniflora TaxID=39325 RepID=A0A7J7M6A2_9MAGN|nr:hypothetical protein GIB67_040949 [Kingdonia uniflora]
MEKVLHCSRVSFRDAMVFHLVKPVEFKVYIIRAYSLSGVDKDFGLRDSEAPAMQNTTCTPIRTHGKTELKCPSTLPFGTIMRLKNLVSESEHERYAKKRKEALDEFFRMEEWKRLDAVLLSLKRRAETHTQKFQEEVNAPW